METVVVKKKLYVLNESEKKLFFKEAALLNGLLHPNIVKLLGVCHQPQAIMLEYVYFDVEFLASTICVSARYLISCCTLTITTAKDFTM